MPNTRVADGGTEGRIGAVVHREFDCVRADLLLHLPVATIVDLSWGRVAFRRYHSTD